MTGTNESHHELDEVLGSHEDRLVNELHKMSSSFESFTQDRRLIANFFDFINFRLVATCKKIETEYFSQRAERIAEDGEKSIKNEVKHLINGATEIVRHKTREKNDEEDEESDHDSELLKIVEDYGENDILKKSSEHLINNVSILEKDVTQSIDIIKSDMPNSFNFPLELIISSESDDNDREKLHDLTTKKRAKRFKGKMTKKQKIDDDIVPNTTNAEGSPNTTNMEINEELEEGEIVEWDDVKNIDPNVIYAKHRFQCRLCKTLETNVILHYKKVHAEFELLISRPSPTMAEKIRRRTENFIYTPHFDQISGICFFCELPRSLSLTEWKKHILYHTGEMEPNTSFDVFSGAQLTAFMCKLCNYIQTDQNRLTKHLRKEHKKCGGEIAIGFEQIILIPDLTPLTPIQVVNKYVFIEEAKRFKCGIGWCDTQLNGFANFKAHLRQKHRNTDENFGCLHCSELINATGKSFLHDVSEHMELHGKFIYSCLFCERVFSERNHVILHIIREHPEKQMKFNYCKREKSNMPEITEQLQIMLKCNLCTEFSYTMEHASAHFKIHHKSLDIDFTTNTLRKFTVPDSTTTLTFTKNTLQTLRRFFECSQCEETRFNEVSLIKHFTKSHQTHSLVLKPGDFFIKAIDPTETSTQLNRIQTVFYCYHCYEGNEKRKFIGFGNCQEVLTHWLATHKEPFRFFIAEMAKCFYCDLMGTYQGLKLHHGDVHSNKKFAIVDVLDPKKCSLCQYIGDRVEEHFQNEHSSISITNLFCPIPLSDKSLKKLIEMKGHKNRLCGLCHQTFETKIDYKVHHGNKHILFKENVEKFYNNESVHLITGCCQAIVDHKKLFNHLKVHPISSQCPNCTFKALDLYEFTAHQLNVHHPGNDVRVVYREAMQKIYWKTKVVFGNGLVLSKHNLLGTKYDDSELFGVFVENIIKNNEEIL